MSWPRVLAPHVLGVSAGRVASSRHWAPGVVPPGKLGYFTEEIMHFVHICMILDIETVTATGNKRYSHLNAQKYETILGKISGGGYSLSCPRPNFCGMSPKFPPCFGACAGIPEKSFPPPREDIVAHCDRLASDVRSVYSSPGPILWARMPEI